MLEVSNLRIRAAGKNLIENISFKMQEGESLGIIGESGSGKTVTVLSLMGLLNPKIYSLSGNIKIFGKEILEMPEEKIAEIRLSEIAIVYQNPFNTFSPVEKIDSQINRIYRIKNLKRNNDKIGYLLDMVGLDRSHLKKYPHELSGGELQRLVIVTSLLLKPRILICDEPTTSLDRGTEIKIVEILNRYRKENGLSLIFITHDLNIIEEVSDKLIVMRKGKIVEMGRTSQIMKNPVEKYSKELLSFLNWEMKC